MVHVFVKHLAEIGAACVRHGSHDFLCLRHIRLVLHFVSRLSLVKYCFPVFSAAYFFSSSTFDGAHRHLRASPFSTCRVRMPAQENFAPCCIRSKTASSPSRRSTFGPPRLAQLPFPHQPALSWGIDNRNLEHIGSQEQSR